MLSVNQRLVFVIGCNVMCVSAVWCLSVNQRLVCVIGCNVMCVSTGVCVEREPETGVCDWL